MKAHSNTASRNVQDPSHPPLARDGYGNPQAIPEGTAGWCLKRETGGRPKMIVGADRQPARFPLDVTADDIEGMVGSGTYRVYAIGADGGVLDYVTTLSVGEASPAESEPAPASPGTSRGASSDLRFALDTILQMSRAQSDSLKAVALAQADWVKGLATAKALPRNGYAVAPPPPTYRVQDEPDDDDDDEDEDDEDEDDSTPEVPSMPWFDLLNSWTPTLKGVGEMAGAWFANKFSSPTQTGSEAPRNAAPGAATGAVPNPMIHLSEINARLTGFERKFLNVLLRGKHGDQSTGMLIAMSVDEAVAFVKENIARLQAEHDAASQAGTVPPTAAPPAAAPPAAASPVEAPSAAAPPVEAKPTPAAPAVSPTFMARLMAGSAYLTAEERATVMWLVPRFPPDRLEELKVKLLKMEPRDAAMWIRENLPALRDEVSS